MFAHWHQVSGQPVEAQLVQGSPNPSQIIVLPPAPEAPLPPTPVVVVAPPPLPGPVAPVLDVVEESLPPLSPVPDGSSPKTVTDELQAWADSSNAAPETKSVTILTHP